MSLIPNDGDHGQPDDEPIWPAEMWILDLLNQVSKCATIIKIHSPETGAPEIVFTVPASALLLSFRNKVLRIDLSGADISGMTSTPPE